MRGCFPMINQSISNPNPSRDISIVNDTKNVRFRLELQYQLTSYNQMFIHHDNQSKHKVIILEIKEQTHKSFRETFTQDDHHKFSQTLFG